jgi:hypothetical protein
MLGERGHRKQLSFIASKGPVIINRVFGTGQMANEAANKGRGRVLQRQLKFLSDWTEMAASGHQ